MTELRKTFQRMYDLMELRDLTPRMTTSFLNKNRKHRVPMSQFEIQMLLDYLSEMKKDIV